MGQGRVDTSGVLGLTEALLSLLSFVELRPRNSLAFSDHVCRGSRITAVGGSTRLLQTSPDIRGPNYCLGSGSLRQGLRQLQIVLYMK